MTKVRSFWKLFCLPGLVSLMFACSDGNTNQTIDTRKNVLFIAIDDLRPKLPAYGNAQVKAPVIDRLANQGYVFTNAFCQMSWCSPSRTSLLTGLRLQQTQVYDLTTHFRNTIPQVVTLPQYFKNHGYLTYGYGKIFHNNPELQDSLSWTEKLWLPPMEHPILAYATESNQKIAASHGNKSYPTEKPEIADNAYPDGMVTDQALQRIEQFSAAEPFFLAVGYYKPHMPFNAPRKYWNLYNKQNLNYSKINQLPKGAPDYLFRSWSEPDSYYGVQQKEPFDDSLSLELIHGYYACISYVDAQIGKLVDALQNKNLLENTLVVIWGDHGWKLRDYGRWSKHSNLDIDTRVPLIIYDPDNQSAKRINSIVELIDLYPTIAAMAGLNLPDDLPGQDLSPVINGQPLAKNFAISQIIHEDKHGSSIRTKNFRYVEWVDSTQQVVFREIYDLEKDSLEMTNQIEEMQYQPIADSLATELKKHI